MANVSEGLKGNDEAQSEFSAEALKARADAARASAEDKGRALAEGSAAEEARRGPARLVEQQVAAPARRERPAEIRVRLAQVGRDRGYDLVGHLRPSGRVEERERPVERGEAPPHRGHVQRRRLRCRREDARALPARPSEMTGRTS